MARLSLETLSTERLKSAAGSTIFERGQIYFHQGRVRIQNVSEAIAQCTVEGSQRYNVEISITDKFLYLQCNCPYAAEGRICKHDVAAALAVQEYLRQHEPYPWRQQLSQVLDSWRVASRQASPRPYLLFFSLQKNTTPFYNSWKISPYQIPLSALAKELHEDKDRLNLKRLQEIVETAPELSFNIKTPYSPLKPEACANCPPESVLLANVLIERARTYAYGYTAFPLTDVLAVISNARSPLFLGSPNNPLYLGLEIRPETGQMQLEVTRDKGGLHLSTSIKLGEREFNIEAGEVEVVAESPLWILLDRDLIKLENEGRAETLITWLEKPAVQIPRQDEAEFLEKYYLPLAEQMPLQGDLVAWETVEASPVRRIYLSESEGVLSAQLRFAYGDYEVFYELKKPGESIVHQPETWKLVKIIRQPEVEEGIYRSLSSAKYGLKRTPYSSEPGTFSLRARLHPIDFLLHRVPRLAQDGFEIYGEEHLKTARVNRSTPTLSFNVSSGIDWFDIQATVNFGGQEVSLKEIQRSLRKKRRYVKLADGTVGEIPEEWIERYQYLFTLGEQQGDGIRMANHHLALIDEMLAGADRVHMDPEFERRRQRLRQFNGIQQQEIPKGFRGELRPYQRAGYEWLHFLKEFEFGGCLADDMGLGKTIQALAFFQSLRENNGNGSRCTNLIVVPRSLLVNWQREAARFTPNLSILEYFEPNRPKDPQVFSQHDLVITTYGILLRDADILRQYTFEYVLLDESQAIKNPFSQTGKAARRLNARHRLVLTGTPMENSSIELWSQFAFLNPGLLGNLEHFKNQFGNPIEKKGDAKAAQFLRKMVFPFILRRTKAQVAPELPPRNERILYSDMEPAQRNLYNRTRDAYRGILLGMIENEGINNTRMKVLEGLLRLRQIANHPRLFDEKFRGESGKFILLLETLETLRSEGHKVLVFSQFVQMLQLVRRAIGDRRIPYAYLDGHTRNRQERVDKFQTDAGIPVFLISLKAGGVGLNLTAADYVIHIDPWWNPAVEKQAADRTHRIGQDKPVFIYKLITRDSVEEKILVLQERKKNLVDQLITTEGGLFKSLSQEDIKVLFS